MSLTSLCNATATISNKSTAAASSSNLGGHVNTFTAVYTDIPVRIQPRRGSTSVDNGARRMNVTHACYTPTDVSSITTGAKLVSGGVTYLIVSWGNMAGEGRGWRIDLERKS